MKKAVNSQAVRIAIALMILGLLWGIASAVLQRNILPDPITVIRYVPRLLGKNIGKHLLFSSVRVFYGMSSATLLGFILGFMMARFSKVNYFLDPILYLVYPVPKLVLLPIIMLLFGLGETSKIIMIILIILPQVVLAVRDSMNQIPDSLLISFSCIGATSWQKFIYILFPAALPYLLTSVRLSLGTAISVLFFTENYATSYGMGFFIMDAWLRLDYVSMYAAIVCLSLVGFVLFFLLDQAQLRLMKWQNSGDR